MTDRPTLGQRMASLGRRLAPVVRPFRRAAGPAVAKLVAGRHHLPSLPLATAAVAGLTAVLLAANVIGAGWSLLPLTSAAAPSPALQPPASALSDPVPLPDLALLFDPESLPEPAAGPPGNAEMVPATGALPVVPEVPNELDDVARELQRRRAELLELQAGLAVREAALRAAQADLSAQVDRLEAFQRRLEALVGEAETEEEERLQQLVKMYESMRAKSAAAIFDRLEMPVILTIAKRMREARMAAILAAMDPNRARLVTTELARERELPRLD